MKAVKIPDIDPKKFTTFMTDDDRVAIKDAIESIYNGFKPRLKGVESDTIERMLECFGHLCCSAFSRGFIQGVSKF